ncbi:actin-like ATPase domain-containing protein [Curvularia clavata]|uniref:Actin-like ATPase domain-containing protein n=1 Tax=Curvularia clavata TaxID=95742 RepID=A0A9Q8ZBS9_CURCL|nr:actin-like ATPase domain-containing protein [Curvularia clavata]
MEDTTISGPYACSHGRFDAQLVPYIAPGSLDHLEAIKRLLSTLPPPPPYTNSPRWQAAQAVGAHSATGPACQHSHLEYDRLARPGFVSQPYTPFSRPPSPDVDDVPLGHMVSTQMFWEEEGDDDDDRSCSDEAPPSYAVAVGQSDRDRLLRHFLHGHGGYGEVDEESGLRLDMALEMQRREDERAQLAVSRSRSTAALAVILDCTPPAPCCLLSPPSLMNSMNTRFKNLVGSKRKSSSHNSSSTSPAPSTTPQQQPQRPTSLSPQASNSSSSSLPMNPQNPLGRPPSYTYAPPGGLGAPPSAHGRPASPLPPINTGAPGYPPQQPPYPPQAGPPGYPPQAGPPPGAAYGHGYGAPPPGAPTPHGPPAAYNRPNTMAEVAGEGRSKAQLIVGIDFGTTFSGVAFAFATNTEAKEDIITEWPGAGNQTKQKIPTVLYYDQYQKVVGWGPDIADALAPTGYPKPGVQKVEWFKLQLMLSGNTYIDPINLPPLPPGKSEIDVAADYLFHLRQAMRNQLQKTLGEVFNREERNIRYYLTVPAIWNDAGKAATRAAAIQAGFLRDENDNRLTLITEPEAAAMFCSKTGLLNLKIHDAVLIVDCGGGTVDLIAYEVEEEQPFSVAECTAGSGDSCGSTALNRNFSNILRAKIRKMKLPDGSKTAGKVYAKCIMDFENRIKADFRNNGQKWAVDVGIEAEFPEAGIEEGYMTFTNEEILQCFEPVVNRILELVRNQIIAIQAQNRSLQNVLVVGGFGASEYLFQQIKLHVPPQFQSKVVRPMDSVAAIVKGAVTAGITERIVTHRVARRHYLMATLQPFKEGHHPEQYRVPSLDGKDRCKYTRQIFVQKGQRVKIGEPVKVSFFRQVAPGATLMYEDILYACDDDVCPEYTKDPRIKEVVTLTSDLSRKNLEKDFERMDTPQGTFYRVYFDIYLTLDGSEFNAELVCQGEVMGRCTARFR